MRLLELHRDGGFSLVEFVRPKIPCYAILSHTWGPDDEEVVFQDLVDDTGKSKAGFRKIDFCARQAANNGLKYIWIDSCCIDKRSSAELQEAINSMFRWYRDAQRCYVYLSDVVAGSPNEDDDSSRRWKPAFRRSRWFTRGWTLQELIAPTIVEFFSSEGLRLGDKKSLERTIHEITTIPLEVLRGESLSNYRTSAKLKWAEKRQTKREEDEIYSLLGIFDVYMPLLYGEGRENASKRLHREIRDQNAFDVWKKPFNDSQRREIMESLRFSRMEARRRTIRNAHYKTCEWLLQRPEYIDWLNANKMDEHHGLLWIKGKPGSGKSTLMKFALETALEQAETQNQIVIDFFFNARGENLEKSTVGTYQALLFQLLKKRPDLQYVLDTLRHFAQTILDGKSWDIETLKSLLQHTLQNFGENTSILCFIDALDECEDWQIREMLSFFGSLGASALSHGTRLHICLSSRYYPHITVTKGLSLRLEQQEGHGQDITRYLEKELKIGSGPTAQQIRKTVQEKASGVFMWIILVVSILNEEYDRGRIFALRRRLREIPNDLHQLFHDMLTREPSGKEELLLCIQWVLYAYSPLEPRELYFAILSGSDFEELSDNDHDDMTDQDIERFIVDISKGLVEITQFKRRSSVKRANFIHESVRDFILKGNGLADIWPDLASNLAGRSHEKLKQCCFRQIDGFRNFLQPFYKYAEDCILYHAGEAAATGISQVGFLVDLEALSPLLSEYSLLYEMAEKNMVNLLEHHPKRHLFLQPEVKAEDTAPLLIALRRKHMDIVKVFVESYISTLSDKDPLKDLCRQYCKSTPKSIPRKVNTKQLGTTTVLGYLAVYGDVLLFSIALDTGNWQIDAADKHGYTPLMFAVCQNHEPLVELILSKTDSSLNCKDHRYGKSPLSWAAHGFSTKIVELLLNTRKVDVGSVNSPVGQTALARRCQIACKQQSNQMIMSKGIDVDSVDFVGRTPLSWAAEYGEASIVKLLLATEEVDVNRPDNDGRSPLSWASFKGREAVVKLLLARNEINVDWPSQNGNTPLLWASSMGERAVLKLLLATGQADVNRTVCGGCMPLYYASLRGLDDVVKLLLATEQVEVNCADRDGRTPLSMASSRGHKAVVKLLLEMGQIDIERPNRDGRTPLFWASFMGQEAVVKLLLRTRRVDINYRDSQGETPLTMAVKKGRGTIVNLLRSYAAQY